MPTETKNYRQKTGFYGNFEIDYDIIYSNMKYAIDFGWWMWFPNNNWHLVENTCGEPEGDEYKTLCGLYLDGMFCTLVQEEQPLLYCKDCRNVRIMEWLLE